MILTFNDNEGQALKNLYDQDFNSETMILLRATKIIRRDILPSLPRKTKFKGKFESNSQQHAAPESLRKLIAMILGGPDIKTQSSNMTDAQSFLSISQLIPFNSNK